MEIVVALKVILFLYAVIIHLSAIVSDNTENTSKVLALTLVVMAILLI